MTGESLAALRWRMMRMTRYGGVMLPLLLAFAPAVGPATAHHVAYGRTRAPLVRDVILVVGNTGELQLSRIDGHQQPLSNLKTGLAGLASAVATDSPGRVGLVRFGCQAITDVPLASGSAHVEHWRQRIGELKGDQWGGSEVHLAIDSALTELVPPIDAPPLGLVASGGVMVIVDAGGHWCQDELPRPGGGMYPEAEASCAVARDAGVTVAVVSLRPSQGRMEACASPGWFDRSNSHDGDDLPAIFEALRERLMPSLNAWAFLPALARGR